MAWPVPHATNAITNLSFEMQSVFNPILQKFNRTQLLWQPAGARLKWSGFRVVSPAIEPARDDHRDFLLLSLFPLVPAGKPAPDQLWSQLAGRANLVYYDWEMTGPRLQQWRLLSGMLWYRPPAQADEMLNGVLAKDNLLGSLGNGIGKTVTEITRAGPNELSIVRTGPLGFSGLEIVLLTDWLSAGLNPLAH
jgi:hypothetical protein